MFPRWLMMIKRRGKPTSRLGDESVKSIILIYSHCLREASDQGILLSSGDARGLVRDEILDAEVSASRKCEDACRDVVRENAAAMGALEHQYGLESTAKYLPNIIR